MNDDLGSKIIVALDFSSFDEAKRFIGKMGEDLKFVKVGLELFCGEGPKVISYLKDKNLNIFLDLKLHDIPNTVKGAVLRVLDFGVDFLTIHASGGPQMLSFAKDAVLERKNKNLKLLAVTILTSLDEQTLQHNLNMPGKLDTRVLNYALMAKENNIDGIICSPNELSLISEKLPQDFLKVTPGIRLLNSSNQDQKRTATPNFAFTNGATHIVVGREITQNLNPKKIFMEIIENGKNAS